MGSRSRVTAVGGASTASCCGEATSMSLSRSSWCCFSASELQAFLAAMTLLTVRSLPLVDLQKSGGKKREAKEEGGEYGGVDKSVITSAACGTGERLSASNSRVLQPRHRGRGEGRSRAANCHVQLLKVLLHDGTREEPRHDRHIVRAPSDTRRSGEAPGGRSTSWGRPRNQHSKKTKRSS